MTSRKMRSLAVALTAALGLAVSGCPKNANPDAPPPPIGTTLSKVGIECRFNVSASDPDFDRVSVRVDWNNGDTSEWTDLFGSGDTTTLGYAWPSPGEYRISAQAKDERGVPSLWSNWHTVVIKDTVNIPPGTPTVPAGPDAGYVDSTYEFSSLAGDENGDLIRLQFDWGDGDTSDWSGEVAESTQVTASHSWLAVGEYSVVSRAMDRKGLVSDWSNVHTMTVTDSLK